MICHYHDSLLEGPFHWERFNKSRSYRTKEDSSNVRMLLKQSCCDLTSTHPKGSGICYINSLPFEILREILILSMKWPFCEDDRHNYIDLISFQKPPLTFIYVCKFWRDVALGTACLWDSIFPSYNSTSCMEKWLQIAPKIPFHLRLVDPKVEDGHYLGPHRIFQLLSKVSHRWKSLSLVLNPILAEEFLSFLQDGKDHLPIKELNIELDCRTKLERDEIPASTIAGIWALIPSRMSLERLRWQSCRIRTFDPQTIPWSQLKTVKLGNFSTAEQFFSYLCQCTSATNVYFSAMIPQNHGQLQAPGLRENPLITLPFLTSLSLPRGADPMILLQYFTFPLLRHLRMGIWNRDLRAFDNFMSRSPHLESVIIVERHALTDRDIVNYLVDPYLRRLSHFALSFTGVEKRGLEIMKLYPQIMTGFPKGLFCWYEWSSLADLDFKPDPCMGWSNNLNTQKVVWSYKVDRLEVVGDLDEICQSDLSAWVASEFYPPRLRRECSRKVAMRQATG